MIRREFHEGIGYSVVELDGLRQVYATTLPCCGGTFVEQTEEALQTLKTIFRKEEIERSIVMQSVFLASAENQAGNILSADSRFADAIDAYTRALALAERCDSISETYRSIWRNNLGYCLMAVDRLEEGLSLVHGSLDFFEKAGAKGYTIIPLVDLCFGYLKMDRWAEARYFGEEALARLAFGGDAGGETSSDEKNVLYLLGEACHLAGDPEAARGYFDLLARLYPDFKNLRSYLEVFDFRNVINLRS